MPSAHANRSQAENRTMPKEKTKTDPWESDIRRGLLRLLVLAVIKESKESFGYAINSSSSKMAPSTRYSAVWKIRSWSAAPGM
jgi:hypothetical protein